MKSFVALFTLVAVASAGVIPAQSPLVQIVLNIKGQEVPVNEQISGPVNPIITPLLPIVAPVQPIVGGAEPIIAPVQPIVTPVQPIVGGAETIVAPVLPAPGSIIAAPVVADLLVEGSIVDTVAIAEPIIPVAAPAIPDIAVEAIPAAPEAQVPSIVVEAITLPESPSAPIGIIPIPESLN